MGFGESFISILSEDDRALDGGGGGEIVHERKANCLVKMESNLLGGY